MAKLQRALSVTDIINKKYKTLPLSPEWHDAFGEPEATGVWFIWGNSGNGKGGLIYKLSKELTRFGKVIINELEEKTAKTVQDSVIRYGMSSVAKKVLFVSENMTDLSARLSKPKAPKIVIVNSFQYTKLNFDRYYAFKEKHSNCLLIFTSQADGKKPLGRAAVSVMYDADQKIWVEGHKAYSKGRYIGPNGGIYTINPELAALYHTSN